MYRGVDESTNSYSGHTRPPKSPGILSGRCSHGGIDKHEFATRGVAECETPES